MKKVLFGILMLAMVCAGSVVCAEEDLTGKLSVGVASGGIFFEDEDLDGTWYIGGNAAYGVHKYLAVGAESGYFSTEDEEDGIEYGDLRAVLLLADLYLRYPVELAGKTVMPYAIGGIGIIFWDYEESSLVEDAGMSLDLDPELGIKAGAGCDYFLTENIALNIESSYVWSDADATIGAFGAYQEETVEMDYWSVNGGLKYYF